MGLDKISNERTVTMKLTKDGLVRGLISTVSLHAITWIGFGVLYYPGLAEMALFFSFMMGLIFIPVYFVQRGNADAGFSTTFLTAHALLCLIELIVLRSFPESVWNAIIAWTDGWGWMTLGYTITFIILLIAGFLPPAIDGLICLVRKWANGRDF